MRSLFLPAFLLALSVPLAAQSPRLPEQRAAAAFSSAKATGPLQLRAFLARMPKGADLHLHLDGAIYAETFLQEAALDDLCLDPTKLALVRDTKAPACPQNTVPAAGVLRNQPLYDALIDAFSMRSFVPTAGVSGHDHFFATFDRFGASSKTHLPDWLDEIASRAAAQNEQYLEVMSTPNFTQAAALGAQFGWPTPLQPAAGNGGSMDPDDVSGTTPAELSALRDKLLAAGLRENVELDRRDFDSALVRRREIEHCDTPAAAAACSVDIRFLYQVLRGYPPQQVFAQTLLAFEVAAHDPNVVGLNFVMPEDGYLAMSEYHRQMLMLDYLHSVYPAVHISLHAGELAPGLVPPHGLTFHIREAVDLGHAERIGHGVDAMYETDPQLLLRELADRHVMIEINLTSNDVILGVSTNRHSLPAYRAAHVPVALSTDDEGVARIDLTHEYTRAAVDFSLSYLDLKQMARTSLEHSFLPGASLWAAPDTFTRAVGACSGTPLGADSPAPPCLDFLHASPHATQQWELEHRLHKFESSF